MRYTVLLLIFLLAPTQADAPAFLPHIDLRPENGLAGRYNDTIQRGYTTSFPRCEECYWELPYPPKFDPRF